jgi:hypothetical protein
MPVLFVTFALGICSILPFMKRASPEQLVEGAKSYCWPVKKMEGAKTAVIDDSVVILSATLTDDAFNINLELGARIVGGNLSRAQRGVALGVGFGSEGKICPRLASRARKLRTANHGLRSRDNTHSRWHGSTC